MERPSDPFEDFFQKHLWRVLHRAGRIVGAHEAEDVAQEVFMAAAQLHARGQFDLSISALAWLRITTYRTARDHMRRLHREQPSPHEEHIDPMDETLHADPERALAVRRQWDELDTLLDTLSGERRLVWVMTEIERMTLAEIAETLEISPNTVGKRLHLARRDFEAAVARKRAADQRKPREAGALLLLPLDADVIARLARALPPPDVSPSTTARIWRRLQAERARHQMAPGSGSLGPRLRSEASHVAALVLGTVVGVLAAVAFADSHGARPAPAAPPIEPIASLGVTVPAPSAAIAPLPAAASASSSPSAGLPPAGPPDAELMELQLLNWAEKALAPPNPNPSEALRILDHYAEQYPESRRFVDIVTRLRREARRLAEQKH